MTWTSKENKIFEKCLAELNLGSPDLFSKISSRIPEKSIDDIKKYYAALIDDINMIESGLIPIPEYYGDPNVEVQPAPAEERSNYRPKKKPVPWTDEEHENFLIGIEKYNKGDWKSISRYCVKSRTPVQVASHAQKFFLKLEKQEAATQNVTASKSKGKAPMSNCTGTPLMIVPQPSQRHGSVELM